MSGDHPRVFVPTPLIFAVLVGVGLAWETNPSGFGLPQALGLLLAAAGLALIGAALDLFRRRHTRPEPWQPATALVVSGVYRRTRNPMYLGMAVTSLGLAFFLDRQGRSLSSAPLRRRLRQLHAAGAAMVLVTACSKPRLLMLRGASMRRLATFFSALMLVLVLWTGTTAHAAERLECVPVEMEVVGHYEWDEDQNPAGTENGIPHHHTGCSGHSLVAPAEIADLQSVIIERPYLIRDLAAGVPSSGPENDLRPPIA